MGVASAPGGGRCGAWATRGNYDRAMSTRTLVGGIALGRLLLGGALLLAPRSVVGPGWVGDEAGRPAAGVLLRAVGARDVGLALGTLAALRSGAPLTPWVAAGALADGTDLAATVGAGAAVPASARAAVGAIAGGAFGVQMALLRTLRRA